MTATSQANGNPRYLRNQNSATRALFAEVIGGTVSLTVPVNGALVAMEEKEDADHPVPHPQASLLEVEPSVLPLYDPDTGRKAVLGVSCGAAWDMLFHWQGCKTVRVWFVCLCAPEIPVGHFRKNRVFVIPFSHSGGHDGEVAGCAAAAELLWDSKTMSASPSTSSPAGRQPNASTTNTNHDTRRNLVAKQPSRGKTRQLIVQIPVRMRQKVMEAMKLKSFGMRPKRSLLPLSVW